MGIHSFESLPCQIWKEAFNEARLRDFKMGETNLPGNPRQRRQDFRDVEQYPLAPNSTAKKLTDQPLYLIDVVKGSYLKNFFWCHSSIFSSQGQVNSKMMTVLMEVENNTMSGLTQVSQYCYLFYPMRAGNNEPFWVTPSTFSG